MIDISAMASEKEGGEAPPLPTQSQMENNGYLDAILKSYI